MKLKYPYLIFDFFYWLVVAIVYGATIGSALWIGQCLWSESLGSNVLVILLSYFVSLHVFVLTLGLLKNIFQPKLVTGTFPIKLSGKYFAWALNSVFHSVFITAPFHKQLQIVFYLNALYFRLMGMKIGLSNLIGSEAIIRQPELISLGEKTIVGIGALISCHFSPDGKNHFQERVIVGSHCVVGGFSQLSPDVIVGDRTVIGAHSIIYPSVRIGSDVRIGVECSIEFGSHVPDKVKIKSNTVITKKDIMKPGDIWGGHPAQLLGNVADKKEGKTV